MRIFAVCLLVPILALGDPALAQKPDASVAPAKESSPNTPPAPNTLLDGTAIKLRLAENLTSATAKTGQTVAFETTEDVFVQGITVLPKGSQAIATVTEANSKKSMGRGGKLNVNVDSTRLADGEKVQLRAVQDNKGGGHVGAMTGAMVATAIVFFPAAPLFLFIKGKDITIPKGTPVTAFVEGDTKLDLSKFSVGQTATGAVPSSVSQTSSLTVDANVPNCDIEIDGVFVGNTPSTLTVAPGARAVTVRKAGYADWTRNLSVRAGAVRLNAEMVAK